MELTKDILCKVLNIHESQSKMQILNWSVDDVAKTGTNYSSYMFRLSVEYQKKDKIFKKSFILKVPSKHFMYETGIKYDNYIREYTVYTTVLEKMSKLDGEHIGPTLYYTDEKYTMILKDLAFSGYKIKDKLEQLDYEHCHLVFTYLAKYHALSLKLDQLNSLRSNMNKFMKGWKILEKDDNAITYISDIYDLLVDGLDSTEYKEKLLKWKNNLMKRVINEWISYSNKFTVLLHGDCWTGNILFKYDKYGNVQKIRFIDFQYCGWNNPAIDILYFTLTSMKFEVFEKYFDVLLHTYIDTFNKISIYFQCKTYELEDLKKDLKMPYTILFLLVHPLARYMSTDENPWDTKIYKNTPDREKFYLKHQKYRELINKWLPYFVNTGIFDPLNDL